jgi:hypothetical protein
MPTVASLKTMFLAQISPGDDEEFLRLLTEADLRAVEQGRWRWTKTRTTLTPVNGYVTLDPAHASILGARVDKDAVDLRDEDFEFQVGGPGEVDLGVGSSKLIDQGLNGDDERYYKVAGCLDDDDVVTALVHYAPATLFDPDHVDSSVPADAVSTTRCPSATALKLMMYGIIFEEAADNAKARSYFADAYKVLDNQEQSVRGGAKREIKFRPHGSNVRPIRNLR